MPVVEVPGVGRVQFPDSMGESDIVSAIKKLTPQQQESGAQNLAKETGIGESLLVGAGKKTDDILNGLTQIYLRIRGEPSALKGLESNVKEGQYGYSELQAERPIATGIGSALPAMAVPGAGASYGGAALAGALPELLSYGTDKERATRGGVGALGGVAGRAIGGLISSVLKPAGAGVNANQAAMGAAKRIGMKPLAGQATQNPAMLNVENYLSRSAGSSGTMQAIAQRNQEAINRAAGKAIGQAGDQVDSSLLGAAEKTIGAEFSRLQSVTAPRLGNDFVDALQRIEVDNAARGAFRISKIDKLIDQGLDLAAQGNLSGKAYKEIRSAISAEATSQFKSGDAVLGEAYKTVRGALDDAAEQSLSKADQEAWRVARDQWSNFKMLTKGNVAEAGNVSAARVAQQMRAGSPAFRLGNTQGPLTDVARIGEGFKGPLNPNSANLISTPLSALTAPANFVGAQIYTSPVIQSYLRSGLLDIGKNGELIIKATGVPLGVAATQGLLGQQ